MSADCVHYVLLRITPGGVEWPVVKTTGGAAVALFTDPDRARSFVSSKGLGRGWMVGRFRTAELRGWLKRNVDRGTELVLVDPDPAARAAEVVTVAALLGSVL